MNKTLVEEFEAALKELDAARAKFQRRCDELDRELEDRTPKLTAALAELNIAVATAEIAQIKAHGGLLQ